MCISQIRFGGCPLQFYQSRSMYHFYCPHESYQKLIFPNNLNESLIKCEKLASYLMNFSENIENDQQVFPAWLLKPIILKLSHSSYIFIKLHNLKILLFLLWIQPTEWNFLFCEGAGEGLESWGGGEWLVISIFFGDRQKPCVNYSYYYK